jgi:5'-nucleotidase / UDP-sugar diphosphatase
MVGGMARIAHLIRSIRADNPNVLVVDAGDIFQGTSFFKLYHGEVEVEMLNRAGYDLYTIGNHEFDDGPQNLATQLARAKFDVLNSNIDASGVPELQAVIKPSVIKTINGQRVGFVGAVVPTLSEMASRTENVRVKASGDEWMKPINEEVAKLKAQGVDKIILVTHVGLELDRELAKNPDIDVIVGGHSHTRLDKQVVVPHDDGTNTVIVQAGSYSRFLGKLDLVFTKDGKVDVANTEYRLIPITDKLPQDPAIKAYLDEKAKPFAHLRNTVLGIASGDFDNQFRRYPYDSPIGNLITDALAEAGKAHGATIALQNRGGIRARIDKGIITQEKLEEILPFENYLVVATIPGDTLLNVLEHSVGGMLGARFLDVAGMKFAYDGKREPGHRVLYAQAQDVNGNWGKVTPDKKYRIAVNSFTFAGGEGYHFTGAADVVESKKRIATVLQEYLLKQKRVKPRSNARIIPVLENKKTASKRRAS